MLNGLMSSLRSGPVKRWQRAISVAGGVAVFCVGFFGSFSLVTSHWSLGHSAEAAVSPLIRYQGQLVDATGQPLNATVQLTIRLYDDPTTGTKIWGEVHAGVTVTNGHFSILLGNGTLEAGSPPLSAVDWSIPLWLSLEVNTDGEMSPRQPITSVPTAITAEYLTGLINTVGSNVGIGTTTPTATLEVVGDIKVADGTQGAGKVLTSDANGVADWQSLPPGVPSGAIILWDGANCPTGYTRLASLDGKFLVGGATFAAAAGGSDTKDISHDHGAGNYTIPPHSHMFATSGTSTAINMDPNIRVGVINGFLSGSQGTQSGPSVQDRTQTDGGGGGISGTSAPGGNTSFDVRPAFATVLLCKKD